MYVIFRFKILIMEYTIEALLFFREALLRIHTQKMFELLLFVKMPEIQQQ